MKALLLTRTTLIWLLLVGATALSWHLGHDLGASDALMAGSLILVVTFIKVRFVMLEFMEIRHAPWIMRAVGEIWCVGICAVLIGLLWFAPG